MSLRSFIGLPLPESYQEQLGAIRKRIGGRLRSRVTWTRQGNWHMTLRFLGEISQEQCDAVIRALDRVREPRFELQAAHAGTFPPSRRPRVLWLGLALGAPQSRRLAGAVGRELLNAGFPPEKRPFLPHLTLARIRQERRDSWERILEELSGMEWPVVTVDTFVLWKSELGSKGPSYKVIEEFELKEKGGVLGVTC